MNAHHFKPSTSALVLGSRRLELATGVDLHYVESGNRDGEPLIFLHGLSDSWRSWENILPLLSNRYHAYVLDQRGHGRSSGASSYSMPDLASDVVAFMDALGIERGTVIGHSMGGLVAHQVAVDIPERVERLVIVASWATLVGNPGIAEFNAAIQALEDPIDPDFVREFQSSTLYVPLSDRFLETVIAESMMVRAAVWKGALAGLLSEDHSDRLDTIRAATLIVWGENDIYITREDQEVLARAIAGSSFVPIAETGHAIHWERPAEFARVVNDFLASTEESQARSAA